ncbi:MAG: hydroxymethylbilane synthase [Candidatus Adiutricales bacterium]
MKLTAIKIGTRGSALALVQANWVKDKLSKQFPDLTIELEIIETKGDKILDVPLANVGGKGLFVKEIEEAVLDGRAHLAVHSIKDVPAEFPEGLGIVAVAEREDFRDVLVSRDGLKLDELPSGARIGTSSLRRRAQLLNRRPDLKIESIRGNVETRLSKIVTENLDGVILAAAGLNRLGLAHKITQHLEPGVMLPAIGQGALGLETRMDDKVVLDIISFLDHRDTAVCVKAERAFLERLEGGCQVPIAALGVLKKDRLQLTGLVADPDGRKCLRDRLEAEPEEAEELGKSLAEKLLDRGADKILSSIG